MFDPGEHRSECEKYLGHHLGCQVELVRAERLKKGTRTAPWQLVVNTDRGQKSYLLQLDPRNLEFEYQMLEVMAAVPVPTPRAYGLDLEGDALGVPCFFSDFVAGETLLGPMQAGEAWAEELYINAVCQLQAVTEEDLGSMAQRLERVTAEDVLDDAYGALKRRSLPLADAAYRALKARMPDFPPVLFSNGDLWLENFLVKGERLAGVIDFPNATFSDPVYEFLLSFFVSPGLQGRGIEERYCRRLGVDPAILHWYHGLEYLDTWRWVLETGESFVHHTAESLEANLQQWLASQATRRMSWL